MSLMVPSPKAPFPGNKRRAQVLVDLETGEDLLLDSEPLRAEFIKRVPALLVGLRLSKGDTFLAPVERVARYEMSVAELADRYVVHPVMRQIVGIAVAGFVDGGRFSARVRLMHLAGPATGFVDGELEPAARKRWRGLGWKLDAAEVLDARGAGRCLLPGCDTKLAKDGPRRRSYCSIHGEHERSYSPAAARRHDRRLESVRELLDEVGVLLERVRR
jgi:hypothetical protein